MKNNQIQETIEFGRLALVHQNTYVPNQKTSKLSRIISKWLTTSLILISALIIFIGLANSSHAANQPIVHLSAPITVLVNENIPFIANYNSYSGISHCEIYIDNVNKGNMVISGNGSIGTASLPSYVFTAISGSSPYSVQARCTDVGGQIGVSNTILITVTTLSPVVGSIFPTSATVGIAKYYYASYESAFDITSCSLYADGLRVDNMVLSNMNDTGSAKQQRYFTTVGNHTLQARCTDSVGNVGLGNITKILVANNTNVDNTPTDEFSLAKMSDDAKFITNNRYRSDFEANNGTPCEIDTYNASLKIDAVLGKINENNVRTLVGNFVACGTPTSLHLGSGERLGVLNSYKTAFGFLPATEGQWNDVLKIANGRFTSEKSASAETRAKASFLKVYLRPNDSTVTSDNNAIAVMAYGLRPLPRNLDSERAAIETFKSVYNRMPDSSEDWDIVRPIAYSGATRN